MTKNCGCDECNKNIIEKAEIDDNFEVGIYIAVADHVGVIEILILKGIF